MNARRAAASSTICATGLAAIAVVLVHVVTVGPPLVGLTVAALGAAVGLAVVALALTLIYAYHSALGSPPPAAVFSGTVLVAISSLAHVLIGINDVSRIRARSNANAGSSPCSLGWSATTSAPSASICTGTRAALAPRRRRRSGTRSRTTSRRPRPT